MNIIFNVTDKKVSEKLTLWRSYSLLAAELRFKYLMRNITGIINMHDLHV